MNSEKVKILEMKNISKDFPGVKALENVSIDLFKGEALGLLGENGAGKSTLIKILSGAYTKDNGKIFIEGQEVDISNPAKGKQFGIRVIYQELNTLDHLSVSENIFLGDLTKNKFGIINWKQMNKNAEEILNRLKIIISPSKRCGDLTVAQKQIVEIARAIAKDAKILIMDEPTSTLGQKDEEVLFSIIRELKSQGISIIYISHKLSEIFEITDKVAVLRDGKLVDVKPTNQTNKDMLIKMMVGRELEEMYPKKKIQRGNLLMEIRGYSYKNEFLDINFDLYRGEILGFFGLSGSGRSKLLNSIFGSHPKEKGTIRFEGKIINNKSPFHGKRNKFGFIPISRKEEGVALNMNVENNITLASIDDLGKSFLINKVKEHNIASKWVKNLKIKIQNLSIKVNYLSGGNQQKVVIAKWLATGSTVLFFNEPTRGIDVGSKIEIYNIMDNLCESGNAIIMSSSELLEVMNIPDRIIVMAAGRIISIFNREEVTKEKLLHAASL